jgi:hypothetical protein
MLDKVPLAEATVRVLSFALDDAFLEDIYQGQRGKSYTKLITFPVITHLVCDALLQNKSGRRVFEKAHEAKALPASVEAAYGKIGRLPAAVSIALLDGCSERVQQLFPDGCEETSLPASLARFSAIVLDGKVTKKIPHRLKPLRDAKVGGLVGGRGLVAYRLQSGLVLGMEGDEDGDANDLSLVSKLAEKLRSRIDEPRLWIADRQFSFPLTLGEFSHGDDTFVVRYSKGVPFFRDDSKASRRGKDDEGREYTEEWGWLGSEKLPHRRYVRRITLQRVQGEDVILVTNLLDADGYSAKDLLEVYRNRTNIEYVFQRITEVFALRRLIGTSPRATLFQLSLCLLLYNVLQLVRAYIACTNAKKLERVSPKKVLEDIREQLAACLVVMDISSITKSLANPGSSEEMKRFLKERLHIWEKRWTKAERYRNRPETIKRRRGHDSVYRVMQRSANDAGG